MALKFGTSGVRGLVTEMSDRECYLYSRAFARHLKDGRIMASRCRQCGYQSFPPRADCPECLSDAFDFAEISGAGKLVTYTRIDAAPAGFRIKKRGIKIVLTGLLFFRPAMMIDGKQDAIVRFAGNADIDR